VPDGTAAPTRAKALLLAAAWVTTHSSVALAAGPLGPQGSRIETSNYGVDLFQGPVLASTRITALGGSFTAIAEGPDGIPFNPAAASLRPPYATTRDDYDLTASITLPSSVEGTDFDNNGHVGFAYDDFFWVTAGGLIQSRHLGLGLIVSFQNYELGTPGEPVPLPGSDEIVTSVIQRLVKIDPVASYGFLDDELHVGAGLRFAAFYSVGEVGKIGPFIPKERILLNQNAVGLQGGALWAPRKLPLRIGGAARSPAIPLNGKPGSIKPNAEGDSVVGNIYLPNRVELPWEIEAGVAFQLWKRPLNLPWYDEDEVPETECEPYRKTVNGEKEPCYRAARRLLKQREAALPRERVLLSFSALLSGPVQNAVGLESMLAQRVDRSGELAVVSLRAGVEAEVLPRWLVLRGGSYLEPTRFRESEPRVHGVTGLDVRVFRSSFWGLFDDGTLFRVSGAVDVARDYFGWSIGAGVFH
jgi:hypothetical protein